MIWPPLNGLMSNVTLATTLFVSGSITDTVLEPEFATYTESANGDVAIETG